MLSVSRLDIADADIILEGAKNKALEIGVPMCIAITDESGNLIAFNRMNGGKVTSITIAQDKAYTAAAAKKNTHDYGVIAQPGMPAYGIDTEVGGRLSIVGGGLLIKVDGQVVGGIGVSSGTPAQDMEVAQAGINYFMGINQFVLSTGRAVSRI